MLYNTNVLCPSAAPGPPRSCSGAGAHRNQPHTAPSAFFKVAAACCLQAEVRSCLRASASATDTILGWPKG